MDDPVFKLAQDNLAGLCENLGAALVERGRIPEAVAAYEQSRSLYQKLLESSPADANYQGVPALGGASVSQVDPKKGDKERAALEHVLRCVGWVERRVARESPWAALTAPVVLRRFEARSPLPTSQPPGASSPNEIDLWSASAYDPRRPAGSDPGAP